jgi:FAD:protein FMN transferase
VSSLLVGAHHVEHVMGMPVSIDIRDALPAASLRDAVDEVVAHLHQVNETWSTWRDDSLITRFARGEIRPDDLPSSMHDVLDQCEWWCSETDGAFDIHVPAPNGTKLETSGFVKGWAIEGAAELLRARGIANFCINAGGDIALDGESSPGEPWRVGLRHPDHGDAFVDVVSFHGRGAVATSGCYERGDHIVDPRTGSPATSVKSATVIGASLTDVDVAATTLFVMGADGLDWLVDRGLDGMVITDDDTMCATAGYLCFRDDGVGLRLHEQWR